MQDASKTNIVLSIEQDQRIDLTADGKAVRGHETYIREYIGVIASGLMARMSNAAYKILHALALRARILGDPRRPGAEEEFEELQRLGIVTVKDKGLLFCFPSREQLMEDTGIGSVHTVDAAMLELSEIKIVKRVSSAQPRLGRGWFGPNIYLIHPESFIAKFGSDESREAETASRHGEQKVLAVNADGEQKLLPENVTESSLRNSVNRALKINNNQQQNEIEIISKHFAASVGIERYVPNEKEIRKIATLFAEGYTVDQICSGITRAIERATQTGRKIHSIAYCIPTVREHAVQAAGRKTEMGSPQPKIVTGQPHAVIQPNSDLERLAQGDAELRELLEMVQERNPGRALQKSDLRAWQALAQRFRDLATARSTTPIALVTQAVVKAIASHSDRDGYLAPRLAETILEAWQREHEENQLQASDAQGQSRRAKQQKIILPAIQTSDGLLDPAQIWETALKELQLQMTKATFDTWVRSTFVAEAQDGEKSMFVIGTHNPYAVEWLEHRLHATIQRTVVGIVGKNVHVNYRCVKASQEK